jgi:cytochrome-b5 reductase
VRARPPPATAAAADSCRPLRAHPVAPSRDHWRARRPDGSRGVVIRPYTPSHTTIGYLELVVKRYEEGKMSRHIHSLKPGDVLDFKGPIMGVPIIQNEFDSVGLVAGGTGITPMLLVAQRILQNEQDHTKVRTANPHSQHAAARPHSRLRRVARCVRSQVHMIFANVTEKDIILREKIEELRQEHPEQFSVYYVLDAPPEGWVGGSGYLTADMLRTHLPPPSLGMLGKVLVCGPPGMVKAVAGDLPKKGKQGELGGLLAQLGYEKAQVFKF